MAYALCGIRPSELEWINEDDLKLMLETASEQRKLKMDLDDARAARITADILNSIAGMVCGVKDPIFSPRDFMPESRGKPKPEIGMDGHMFKAWAEAHNKQVDNEG